MTVRRYEQADEPDRCVICEQATFNRVVGPHTCKGITVQDAEPLCAGCLKQAEIVKTV